VKSWPLSAISSASSSIGPRTEGGVRQSACVAFTMVAGTSFGGNPCSARAPTPCAPCSASLVVRALSAPNPRRHSAPPKRHTGSVPWRVRLAPRARVDVRAAECRPGGGRDGEQCGRVIESKGEGGGGLVLAVERDLGKELLPGKRGAVHKGSGRCRVERWQHPWARPLRIRVRIQRHAAAPWPEAAIVRRAIAQPFNS